MNWAAYATSTIGLCLLPEEDRYIFAGVIREYYKHTTQNIGLFSGWNRLENCLEDAKIPLSTKQQLEFGYYKTLTRYCPKNPLISTDNRKKKLEKTVIFLLFCPISCIMLFCVVAIGFYQDSVSLCSLKFFEYSCALQRKCSAFCRVAFYGLFHTLL